MSTTWVLVREVTNEEVKIGDTITSFRGDKNVLKGGTPPRYSTGAGRVFVEGAEYFPSVFNLAWIQLGVEDENDDKDRTL
jgi:hypothetical protein